MASSEEVWGKKRLPQSFSTGFRIFFENQVYPLLHLQGSFREISGDLVRPDGSKVPVLINGLLVKHDDGTSFFHFSLFDISQRRMYEAELLAATRRAEQLSATLEEKNKELSKQQELILEQKRSLEQLVSAKNRFFGIIAHDLRSPLSQLSAFVQLIEIYMRKERFSDIQDLCDEMNRSLSNTLKLTDNLLTWSQLLTENLKPVMTRFDVGEIVDEIAALYQGIARGKGVKLTKYVKHIHVYADAAQVAFIVRNLLDNAIKFAPGGGNVIIDLEQRDDRVWLSVTDTGGGIPESIRDSIFSTERKYKFNGTNGERGTGLGLILTHGFVEKNNGEINVDSSSKGTRFTVTFPLPNSPANLTTGA